MLERQVSGRKKCTSES